MHVLVILDPLPSLNAYKDSSVAMMRALVAREHTLSVALQPDLYIEAGRARVRSTRVELVEGADLHQSHWWRESGEAHTNDLAGFDAILMRKDPPFDMEYVYATHVLELAERQGARVFNRAEAIRNHPEKLSIMEFGQFTAPTLVSRDMTRLRAFHREYGDVVVKPLDGMGGSGVFRMRSDEVNVGAILETLTELGARTIMAQQYLPAIAQGDKRILLIDGKPVPYSLARIPLAGETRGNLAAGGRGVAQPLSARDHEIADTVGPVLAERGLLLVGLDVIGENLTEINVTSPTCFVEISEQTGFDVAAHFAAALENRVGH